MSPFSVFPFSGVPVFRRGVPVRPRLEAFDLWDSRGIPLGT